jgi:crotonobetainyl-CoA:carnitine CoA-transferase CaiB-like acyl-CoA transferase
LSGAGCVWLNRGKESVVLDIKAAEDKALLEQLIAKADVFIQNLAPGAMARAGFASAALRERHPRLITVDISGYGEEGEYAGMKATTFWCRPRVVLRQSQAIRPDLGASAYPSATLRAE